jgi:ABC-type amino acid transport substrate-binding protein
MMKFPKIMISAGVLACVTAATVSATLAADGKCLDQIRARGELVAGVGNVGQKPLVWQDANGQFQGYEWEVLKYIRSELGVPKVSYQVTEWPTLVPGLQASRWDIIMSAMIITQERAQGGDFKFSNPYFLFYDNFMVLKNSLVQSPADLKGKKVGTVLGTMDSLNAHQLEAKGDIGQAVDFNTYGDPFVALRNGQVDAVLLDQASFYGQQQEMNDLRVIGSPLPFQPNQKWADVEAKQDYVLGSTGIGVRKECGDLLAAINAAVDKLNSSGTRQALEEKFGLWGPTQVKLTK